MSYEYAEAQAYDSKSPSLAVAARAPQVSDEVNRYSALIEDLTFTINTLGERLIPVSLPVPSDPQGSDVPERVLAPLAERLSRDNDTLARRISALRSFIEGLEV